MKQSRVPVLFAALALLLALPHPTHAQSAIAGVVKDTSGAVLPASRSKFPARC